MRSLYSSTRIFCFLLCSLLFLLTACGESQPTTSGPTSPSPTPTIALDAYGAPITFPQAAPQRIVSLIPSTSEILGALGLESHVVAVDYYTNYPASMAALPKISDATAKYDIEKIVALRPDLVLSYGAETKQYDTQLKNLGFHVVDLPLASFSQSLQQILLVGRLTFTQDTSIRLYQQLQQQIEQIKAAVAGTTAPKVMIELDNSTPGKPYVFGGGSFGDDLLKLANAQNVFGANTGGQGYPQVTDEAVISANPQFIILTEDPKYGGDATTVYKRPNWASIEALKTKHVYNVSGDLMSRPGPRLVQGLQCVAQLVHPEKFSAPLPAYCAGAV